MINYIPHETTVIITYPWSYQSQFPWDFVNDKSALVITVMTSEESANHYLMKPCFTDTYEFQGNKYLIFSLYHALLWVQQFTVFSFPKFALLHWLVRGNSYWKNTTRLNLYTCIHNDDIKIEVTFSQEKLEQLQCLRSEIPPHRLMITHSCDSHQIPSQNKTKSKLQFKKKMPKIKILKFCKKLYTRHTFWSCSIRCVNMKRIQPEL